MASRFIVPFGGRSLTGRDPFLSLHREMNRLFDDTLRSVGANESGPAGFNVPQLDVHVSEQEFCITADLPGVAEDDIELTVNGDMLMLKGEKKQHQERDERGYHVIERSSGAFQRSVRLPFEPDPGKVVADYENGVLTVHVPKQAHQERSRRIEVKRGSGPNARTIESASANDQGHAERQQAASGDSSGQAGGADDTSTRPQSG
jgi:HSP20 family protein